MVSSISSPGRGEQGGKTWPKEAREPYTRPYIPPSCRIPLQKTLARHVRSWGSLLEPASILAPHHGAETSGVSVNQGGGPARGRPFVAGAPVEGTDHGHAPWCAQGHGHDTLGSRARPDPLDAGELRELRRSSSGLRTASPPRVRTCVYIIVVFTSLCPMSSCTVLMSSPFWSRCVAKLWRNVWQLTRLRSPARRAASLTAFCHPRSRT